MSKSNVNHHIEPKTGLNFSIRLTETAMVSIISTLIGMGIGVTININSKPSSPAITPVEPNSTITTGE